MTVLSFAEINVTENNKRDENGVIWDKNTECVTKNNFYYLCHLKKVIKKRRKKMTSLPKNIFRLNGYLLHMLAVPFLTLGFFLMFKPAIGFDAETLPVERYSFHITMLSCILLGVLAVSRSLLLGFNNKMTVSWKIYASIIGAEILATTAFGSLYLWLIMHGKADYFDCFGKILIYATFINLDLDTIIDLYFLNADKEERLHDSQQYSQNGKIRFFDDKNSLKLIVAVESILHIRADENYLKICYLDNGKITNYSLRSSMKRIEELCEKNGIVRCHRSYFVNKNHIKVLQKDKDNVYAILDEALSERIPVSKNYYDHVSQLL